MREPLAWVGWAVVVGALSWPWWRPEVGPLLWGVACLGLLAWAGREAHMAALAAVVAGFLLGAAAPALLPPTPEARAHEYLRGEVLSSSGSRALVAVDAGGGRAELWFPGEDRVPQPGQRLAAWTQPSTPMVHLPGDWGHPADAERAHRISLRVRAWIPLEGTDLPTSAGVRRGAAWYGLAQHGGLLWALASGDRAGVSEEDAALLRRTGTAHLLAISGLHIGLVAGMAWGVCWWLSRPLALLRRPWLARIAPALASVGAGLGYAALVGWPVSAQRAALMVVLAAGARLLGRQASLWTLLGLAAAAVVLVDAGQVSQPAFWMSFGAVAGILSWSYAVTRLLPPDHPRWLGGVVGSLAASVGATLGTLPVTAWLFQQLSPLSPLTNLIAVPLMASVAVPAALAAPLLPGDLGLLALAIADSATEVTLRVLRALDVPPWAPAVGPVGALLLAALLPLRRQPLAAAGLALLALTLVEQPLDRLRVTFLPIGQGDSILVEWPDGRRWLVDGGPPSERLLFYLRRRHIHHLDAILLSHPDADHLGGLLPVMAALDVDALWVPRPPTAEEADFLTLWRGAFAQQTTIHTPADAALLAAQGGELLHPLGGWQATRKQGQTNEASLVVRLQHGRRSLLLTGDIEQEGEAAVVEQLGAAASVDVVKVAHHGSLTSSTAGFVAATGARWAVVSCGVDNRFRHPRPLVLWRWQAAGARVLRTDLLGRIVVETDGEDLWISAPEAGRRWHAPVLPGGPPTGRSGAGAAPPSAG